MSRVANAPVNVPGGVDIKLDGQSIAVKGSNGELNHTIHDSVEVVMEDAVLSFKARNNSKSSVALAGTTRALVNNMVTGVSAGFEKKLTLIGVGYRAAMKGKVLNLSLGYSHPIDYDVPAGITIECPSATEVVVKGADKQRVGQTAAEIRAFRSPEPYKGKGVRYADEHIKLKEAKKK